jgi:uncharacterized membrane protein YuzA (DUF378 family)
MLDITLKKPLGLLAITGLVQGNHPCLAGIQVLHETLNRSPFTRGVSSLKENHHLFPCLLHPLLKLQKFHLKRHLVLFIDGSLQFCLVGIFTTFKCIPDLGGVMSHLAQLMQPLPGTAICLFIYLLSGTSRRGSITF